MVKKINLVLVLAGIALNCFGQTPKFQKFYSGDYSYGVGLAETDSGFMMLCNKYMFGTAINNFSLVATDSSGNFSWYKKFSLLNHEAAARNIFRNTDGGFFVLGNIDDNTGSANSNIFLLKVDASGNPLWAKTYDGGQDDYATNGQLTNDGGMIICGQTVSYTVYKSPFLLKVDSTGNIQWSKIIDFSTDAYGESVEQTTDSGFIFVNTYYLIKTDANGNIQWLNQMDYTGMFWGCIAHLVKETSDHGYIISGIFYYASSFLYKTDITGNVTWTKYYYINSGALPNLDVYSMSIDQNDNIIMSGLIGDMMNNYNQDMLLFKTDGSGNPIWAYSQGTPNEYDRSNFVYRVHDGSYISIGAHDDFGSSHNVYLAKTDLNGSSGCNESSFSVNSDTLTYQQLVPGYSVLTGFTSSNVTFTVGNSLHSEVTLCNGLFTNELLVDKNINIFPNPATSTIQLTLPKDMKGEVEIVNVMGKKVYQAPPRPSPEERGNYAVLDVSGLVKGVYVVRVGNENRKLVIE